MTFSHLLINSLMCRCRVLVVGGGTGGCSVAAKLSYRYGAGNIVVLDSAEVRKSESYLQDN